MNQKDYKKVVSILYFYRDDVSHGREDCVCGLDIGSKEWDEITELIIKVQRQSIKDCGVGE